MKQSPPDPKTASSRASVLDQGSSLLETHHREEKMKMTKCLILCLVLLCGAALLGAQAPQWQWAVKAGGMGWNEGHSIAIDSQGNQYVTGHFQGTATFGSYTLTASGRTDVFVAKLDPSGDWLWAVKAGGTRDEIGRGIILDDAGNSWVTGYFTGTATFGSQTLTSSGRTDVFVARLDPSGNWLWAVKAGGTEFDKGHDIAVDNAGNAWVTGYFTGTATFGNQTLTSSGEEDIFVARLGPSGNWLWTFQAGGTGWDEGYSIVLDEAGDAWLTGYFSNTATFGCQTLTSSGRTDIFVAKLNPSGNWLWAVQAGGIDYEFAYSIALDKAGNAWVTGYFGGTIYFDSIYLMFNGGADVFVARLDPSGKWLWAVNAGGTSYECGYSIALDGACNAWVTGYFMDTATFGNQTLNSEGMEDIFIARLDPSGNWLWAVQAGGTDIDYVYDIAVDDSGNAWVTGYFYETATFGIHTLTASGESDIFVAKLGSGTPVEDELAPQALARLHNAYPNPLNRDGSALIKADIPERSSGTLSIFNLRGQIVARHKLSSGSQQVSFSGEGLPAGVYLYSLQCGDYRETRKLVLLK